MLGRVENSSPLSEAGVFEIFFFDWLRSRGTRFIIAETCGDDGLDELTEFASPGTPEGLCGVFGLFFSDSIAANGITGDAKEHGGRQRMDGRGIGVAESRTAAFVWSMVAFVLMR